ncbi:ATP-binding protein [Streptomyces olivoreticuli]
MKNVKQVYGFPCSEETPGDARKAVRHTVLTWGLAQEIADTAELLVSELVTNAVIHAQGSDFCLVICRARHESLSVIVVDDGHGVPTRRASSDSATNGRGLILVDCLADGWGVHNLAHGKAVYFRLKLQLPLLAREAKPWSQGETA